jgi:hypothetical protein
VSAVLRRRETDELTAGAAAQAIAAARIARAIDRARAVQRLARERELRRRCFAALREHDVGVLPRRRRRRTVGERGIPVDATANHASEQHRQ